MYRKYKCRGRQEAGSDNFSGLHIAVPQLLLYRAYIRARLQQMGSKRMAQCVAGHLLPDPRPGGSLPYQFVQRTFIKMVAPQFARLGING